MVHLKIIVIIVVTLIWNAEEKYYQKTVNKLRNTKKNSEVYWLLLKLFVNNKKIPMTPTTVLRKLK